MRTVFVSNGVGKPVGVQSSPMRWSRVSQGVLEQFCERPLDCFYTPAQIAAAKRELHGRNVKHDTGS